MTVVKCVVEEPPFVAFPVEELVNAVEKLFDAP
jgi:hypothetical protein